MRIFPVLGNHDAFPKSQFPSNHSAGDLYEEVGDVWKDFLQPVGAYDSFKTKGKISAQVNFCGRWSLGKYVFFVALPVNVT